MDDAKTITPDLDRLLGKLWAAKGTDLHITVGSKPRTRANGELSPLEDEPEVAPNDVETIANALLSEDQKLVLKQHKDVDFSFSWGEDARVRGSAFTQHGYLALALRIIPTKIPTIDELGLPEVARTVAQQSKGFVLVTGPTGSGKSTSLAAIVDEINRTRRAHILTIEDPVEYVHHHKMSMISQREVGEDSPSFARALRSALREDPDVLLVGEMRDNESIEIALTMAETGHLVLATLHTNDAPQAIDRIIDVFPAEGQAQIRVQLGGALNTIIAQRLLPKIGGGLIGVHEVLVATNPIRNLIREGRTNQIANSMITGAKEGMILMENNLARLIQEGVIDEAEAMSVAPRPNELARLLGRLA